MNKYAILLALSLATIPLMDARDLGIAGRAIYGAFGAALAALSVTTGKEVKKKFTPGTQSLLADGSIFNFSLNTGLTALTGTAAGILIIKSVLGQSLIAPSTYITPLKYITTASVVGAALAHHYYRTRNCTIPSQLQKACTGATTLFSALFAALGLEKIITNISQGF